MCSQIAQLRQEKTHTCQITQQKVSTVPLSLNFVHLFHPIPWQEPKSASDWVNDIKEEVQEDGEEAKDYDGEEAKDYDGEGAKHIDDGERAKDIDDGEGAKDMYGEGAKDMYGEEAKDMYGEEAKDIYGEIADLETKIDDDGEIDEPYYARRAIDNGDGNENMLVPQVSLWNMIGGEQYFC